MPYERLIHFADTDSAGVVFFANVLTICHEAYEDALIKAGFDLKLFFRNVIAVPIVRAEIDFRHPIFCGDRLIIQLNPQQIDTFQFAITYTITNQNHKIVSTAQTQHICINAGDRTKVTIPEPLQHWLCPKS